MLIPLLLGHAPGESYQHQAFMPLFDFQQASASGAGFKIDQLWQLLGAFWTMSQNLPAYHARRWPWIIQQMVQTSLDQCFKPWQVAWDMMSLYG